MSFNLNIQADWTAAARKGVKDGAAKMETASLQTVSSKRIINPSDDIVNYVYSSRLEGDIAALSIINRELVKGEANIEGFGKILGAQKAALREMYKSATEANADIDQSTRANLMNKISYSQAQVEQRAQEKFGNLKLLNGSFSGEIVQSDIDNYGTTGKVEQKNLQDQLLVKQLLGSELKNTINDSIRGSLGRPYIDIMKNDYSKNNSVLVDDSLNQPKRATTTLDLTAIKNLPDSSWSDTKFSITADGNNNPFIITFSESSGGDNYCKIERNSSDNSVNFDKTINNLMEKLRDVKKVGTQSFDFSYGVDPNTKQPKISVAAKVAGANSNGITFAFEHGTDNLPKGTTAGGLDFASVTGLDTIRNNLDLVGKLSDITKDMKATYAAGKVNFTFSCNGVTYSSPEITLATSSTDPIALTFTSNSDFKNSFSLQLSGTKFNSTAITSQATLDAFVTSLGNDLSNMYLLQRREILSYTPEPGSVLRGSKMEIEYDKLSSVGFTDTKITRDPQSSEANPKFFITISAQIGENKVDFRNMESVSSLPANYCLELYENGQNEGNKSCKKLTLSLKNALDLTDESTLLDFSSNLHDALGAQKPQLLSFQTDLDPRSKVSIKIPAMTLKALNLDDISVETKEDAAIARQKIDAALKTVETLTVRLSSFSSTISGFVDALNTKKEAFQDIDDVVNKADVMEASRDMSNASQQMSVSISVFGTILRAKGKLTQLIEAAANAG